MIAIALIFGLFASFSVILLIPQEGMPITAESYLPLIVPMALILALAPVISVMMSARIHIERQTGEVRRLWSVFGRILRKQQFHVSDFERVSLSRTFRRGYQVALIGQKQDLTVFLTSNLATARDRAAAVATACGITVTDHL